MSTVTASVNKIIVDTPFIAPTSTPVQNYDPIFFTLHNMVNVPCVVNLSQLIPKDSLNMEKSSWINLIKDVNMYLKTQTQVKRKSI